MEHYLGEKLKKLRESRGWTQADLAKRLNKAVSTASGYESDAHAIPLDVLASISSLFSISTDELLGLDAPEVLSLSGLTGAQKKTLIKLRKAHKLAHHIFIIRLCKGHFGRMFRLRNGQIVSN